VSEDFEGEGGSQLPNIIATFACIGSGQPQRLVKIVDNLTSSSHTHTHTHTHTQRML